MIFAGILAGGTGSRMESATMPKQFLKVCDIPIFIRCIRTFLSVDKIDKVIVSMNIDYEDTYRSMLDEYGIDKNRVVLTAGGDSRFTSLYNVVKKASEIERNEDTVIITHDCARLFVSQRIIEDNLNLVKEYDMVTTSLPVIDTILQSEDGKSTSFVPDRSKLFADQGPQTFGVDKFLKYYAMIPPKDIPSYIEAGKLYLSHGCQIGIVKGERFNFKVTNDIDLQYAEFLLKKGFVK